MRLSLITWPRALMLAMVVAFWPVWRWYVSRAMDGSDEPYGLIALATLAVVMLRNGIELPRDEKRFLGAAIPIALYVTMFHILSPLPRAFVAAAVIASVCFQRRTFVSRMALLGLSLPLVATTQFYLGYPLRLAAAETSVIALRALAFGVTREGTMLHWRGETIMVDAPCSGVRMLWFGLYLAATLAAVCGLSNRRSMLVLTAGSLVVLVANIVRAVALFFKEARIVALPDWTHAGIGIVIFAAASLLIVRLATGKEATQCAA